MDPSSFVSAEAPRLARRNRRSRPVDSNAARFCAFFPQDRKIAGGRRGVAEEETALAPAIPPRSRRGKQLINRQRKGTGRRTRPSSPNASESCVPRSFLLARAQCCILLLRALTHPGPHIPIFNYTRFHMQNQADHAKNPGQAPTKKPARHAGQAGKRIRFFLCDGSFTCPFGRASSDTASHRQRPPARGDPSPPSISPGRRSASAAFSGMEYRSAAADS